MRKSLAGKLILLAPFVLVVLFVGSLGVGASNIKDARKYAEETLLPLEGIAGISHSENPPKIIVYVEHEKYRQNVPKKIKGFETEVIVIGKIRSLGLLAQQQVGAFYDYGSSVSRTGNVRPIVGGISIGVPEENFGGKMAGTLGLIVVNGSDAYILSNAHVIAMNRHARFLKPGTAVLQPGTYDGGNINDKVGELYRYIPITFGPKGRNYADAAIAKVVNEIECRVGEVLGSDNRNTTVISGITDVRIGETVSKSGRTTGVTSNTVSDTSATVKVWYTSGKWAAFYDQILVNQPFLDSGDSGSAVYKDGKFVGLAFAGSSEIAVVCKAQYITQGLGISI